MLQYQNSYSYDMSNADTHERKKIALAQAENELGISGTIVTRQNFLEFLSTL